MCFCVHSTLDPITELGSFGTFAPAQKQQRDELKNGQV